MKIKHLLKVMGGAFLFYTVFAHAMEADIKPRFMSLRHDEANLRTGPGRQFPISWVYKQKNYPLEVIDVHELWYQVRDVDGTTGWMNQAMLRSQRYVLVKKEEKLKDKPALLGRSVAVVQAGTIGRVVECPKETSYCFLEFKQGTVTAKGWLDKSFFYGVYPDEEISD